jgi:hypothetical protein
MATAVHEQLQVDASSLRGSCCMLLLLLLLHQHCVVPPLHAATLTTPVGFGILFAAQCTGSL